MLNRIEIGPKAKALFITDEVHREPFSARPIAAPFDERLNEVAARIEASIFKRPQDGEEALGGRATPCLRIRRIDVDDDRHLERLGELPHRLERDLPPK